MEFKEIVKKRYSSKKFDGRKISNDKIDELLEIIRLSPSSFNAQPWKIKVISDPKLKEQLAPASFHQPQITTCSHLLVLCADTDITSLTDNLKKLMTNSGILEENAERVSGMARSVVGSYNKNSLLNWAQKQVYIAMGNAVNGAKSLNFDSCPMEGFNPKEYSKILNLPENLVPTLLIAVGYAADKPKEKLRFPKEDVFF